MKPSFKLKVTLDPAKHAKPHHEATLHEKGYACGCVVSEAVNDALRTEGNARFRRWESAYSDTGLLETFIKVTYRNGTKAVYSARLRGNMLQARRRYDHNRGEPAHMQLEIPAAKQTLTYTKVV